MLTIFYVRHAIYFGSRCALGAIPPRSNPASVSLSGTGHLLCTEVTRVRISDGAKRTLQPENTRTDAGAGAMGCPCPRASTRNCLPSFTHVMLFTSEAGVPSALFCRGATLLPCKHSYVFVHAICGDVFADLGNGMGEDACCSHSIIRSRCSCRAL